LCSWAPILSSTRFCLLHKREADKITEWLKQEINEACEKRKEVKPRYEGAPKPKVFEILRLLPKANCRECGHPARIVFAARIAESVKGVEHWPQILEENSRKVQHYIMPFRLND
jgi:ArsR family metal-binding transcriptional regulator